MREPFIATILCSFVSVGVLLIIICRHFRTQQLTLILALLIASKAFMDYTTGGLENPLSYFACRVLCRVLPLFRHRRAQGSALCATHRVGSAAFRHTAGSCTPCRPIDFLGIHHILPPGGSAENTGDHRNLIATGNCVVRVSLIYYGFLVPNTAFAKLGHGITRIALIKHGLAYLLDLNSTLSRC